MYDLTTMYLDSPGSFPNDVFFFSVRRIVSPAEMLKQDKQNTEMDK